MWDNQDLTIQKNSPIPLYFQLKEILRKKIEAGELKDGDAIPSERELIKIFQISRPTVRQAINELVVDGILERKQGYGTFVNKPKRSQWFLESLASFSDESKKKGFSTKTNVLSMEVIQSTEEINKLFNNDYEEYYCLERLRYVEEQPVVLVTTYIPCSIVPNLHRVDFSRNSLYDTLLNDYQFNISYAERTLEAIIVDENDYKPLGISPTSPVQLVKTISYLENGNVFEYSISRFRADLSSFKARLKFN